jgi:hypothetical protein
MVTLSSFIGCGRNEACHGFSYFTVSRGQSGPTMHKACLMKPREEAGVPIS